MDDHVTYTVDSETAATIRSAIDSLSDTHLGSGRSRVSSDQLLYKDNIYVLMYVVDNVLLRLRFTRSAVYVAGAGIRGAQPVCLPEIEAAWCTEKCLADTVASMLSADWEAAVDDVYKNKHIDSDESD